MVWVPLIIILVFMLALYVLEGRNMKINSRCPSCNGTTLELNDEGGLFCTWTECRAPTPDMWTAKVRATYLVGDQCVYLSDGTKVVVKRSPGAGFRAWLEVVPQDNRFGG